MNKDTNHLNALELRLSHEREYLRAAEAVKDAKAAAIRKIWIAQIEKEIAGEKKFLGISDAVEIQLSDDELLAALKG